LPVYCQACLEEEKTKRCQFITPARWYRDTPTQCSHRAQPGSDFCAKHQPPNADVSDGEPLTHESTEARTRRSLH